MSQPASSPEPCKTCEGKKDCPDCLGRGTRSAGKPSHDSTCPTCNGEGKCPDCLGSGQKLFTGFW